MSATIDGTAGEVTRAAVPDQECRDRRRAHCRFPLGTKSDVGHRQTIAAADGRRLIGRSARPAERQFSTPATSAIADELFHVKRHPAGLGVRA
nr:hypothetical protein [Microbacterium bovistercoris]